MDKRGINWWLVAALTLFAIDAGTWFLLIRAGQVDVVHPAADYNLYMNATSRWLAGGPFYHPYQLAGPYAIWELRPPLEGPILYPPVALWLFALFTVLPPILWWAIPIGIVGWRFVQAPWNRRLLALALIAWPQTYGMVVGGNPGMWIVAALALGTRWPFASPFVLLKPTLAPFALVGIRSRWWWVGLGLFGLLCLPFGAMWADWLTAVRNSGADLSYSLSNLAPMLIPLAATWQPRPS